MAVIKVNTITNAEGKILAVEIGGVEYTGYEIGQLWRTLQDIENKMNWG